MTLFLNFTNHPFENWSDEQKKAAQEIGGEIKDLPFPAISPQLSADQIKELANSYVEKIVKMSPSCVLCQGESVFSSLMAFSLTEKNIRTVSAVSERKVLEYQDENGRTVKKSIFEFCGFRDYLFPLNNGFESAVQKKIFVNPHKEIENLYKSLKQWDKGRPTGHTYDTSWRIQIGYGHEIVVRMIYHEADGYNDAYVYGDVYFIFRKERVKPCPADEAVDAFTDAAIRIYNEQLERKKQGKIYF